MGRYGRWSSVDLPTWTVFELDFSCEMQELKEVFSVSSLSFCLCAGGTWSLGFWITNFCSLLLQSDGGPPPVFVLSWKALSGHKSVPGLNMSVVVSVNVQIIIAVLQSEPFF